MGQAQEKRRAARGASQAGRERGGLIVAGFDIREMMNDIDEAPGKVWFWDLEKAVIDADRCVQCGVCVAACPTDSIGIGEDDLPKLVKMCTGCSLCWDFCPRGGLRYEALGEVMAGVVPHPPPPPPLFDGRGGTAAADGVIPSGRSVIPRHEKSRRPAVGSTSEPRFFAAAQNDMISANGHSNGNGHRRRRDNLGAGRE